MSCAFAESQRIAAEYSRRARELPADYYSWSRPANLFQDQCVARACVRMLHDAKLFPLDGLRVCDAGCGVGTWLLEFIQWGANPATLAGIDLMSDRLERARLRLPSVDLRQGSATELPWPSASFDLVTQIMMFTSILDPETKRGAAREMMRVLKPGGSVLWMDFRVDNPRNTHVRGIGRGEIRSLFPDAEIRLNTALLAPPLARRLAPVSWLLAEALHTIPILRTHYVAIIRKNAKGPL